MPFTLNPQLRYFLTLNSKLRSILKFITFSNSQIKIGTELLLKPSEIKTGATKIKAPLDKA